MSPDMKQDFEHEWAELSPRLRTFLVRKKVPVARHDDLVQEVALRLLLMWPQVDRARPLWPLAVTIAMNLIRDLSRVRPVREVYGHVPDVLGVSDVETSGLARVEIDRVRRAMAALTAPQRESLLKEIGAANGNGHSVDAEKMLRLRARRKLSEVLRDVSAVAMVRYRRSMEWMQGLISIRDGLAQSSVCLLCLLAGITGGVVVEPTPHAEAAPLDRGYNENTTTGAHGSTAFLANASGASQLLRPEAFGTTTSDDATGRRGRATRGTKDDTGTASLVPSLSPPSLLPGGGDAPVPVPGGAPPVPSAEAPTVEAPAAEPPSPPEPPVQAPIEVVATIEETAGSLVAGK